MDDALVMFQFGPLALTRAVVSSWGLTGVLALLAWLATRRLSLEPGRLQSALEGVVELIREAVEEALPGRSDAVFPFIGTLWIYIGTANLLGVVPGLSSPTGDLSATSALAIMVFLSVHWFGIRAEGLPRYLSHYLRPNPLLLPFHIVSEISRTLALSLRLFGNVMSLEIAAMLVLMVAGFLAPIPVLMLHIVEALVQAYIFGMLALVYISGAIQSREDIERRKSGAQ